MMFYLHGFHRNWPGHHWAQPSLDHLRHLMRSTYSNPSEVQRKGIQARLSMVANFSLEVVGQSLVSHLERVKHSLKAAREGRNGGISDGDQYERSFSESEEL